MNDELRLAKKLIIEKNGEADEFRIWPIIGSLASPIANKWGIHERDQELIDRVWQKLSVNPEEAEGIVDLALRECFESFVGNDGKTYWLDMTFHRTEEGITLQEHYNQRRLVEPYTTQSGYIGYRMELPNGSDEPDLLGVYEPTLPTDALELFRCGSRMPETAQPATVRPIIRWSTDPEYGTRTLVQNRDLAPTETRSMWPNIEYADTLTGRMILATACPDLVASWPKTAKLADGSYSTRYEGTSKYRELVMGEAQVPLLVLMSEARVQNSPSLEAFERSARALS